jgi:hypothetical protein
MKTLLFCFFITGTVSCIAQTNAVTSNGDEVILYNNGTWKYVDKTTAAANKIDTSKMVFTKNTDATFLMKSNVTSIGVHLNPKKWSFKKAESDEEAAEYSLQLKGKDAYAMVLTERIEIPLENLKGIALENAKAVSPDVKIVKEEYRVVNGVTVLCLQMNGTAQGIKFSYMGYYYSFEKGTVQFVTYTAQSLMKDYINDLEDLLNGFVVIK